MLTEPKEGQFAGPYRLHELLAVGGMGHIHRAMAPDGTEVVIKLVKAQFAADRVFRKRFDREASVAVRLRHPNVVPILDRGEEAGIPYLAQRYMRGGTLAERIERPGFLPVEVALAMCLHVGAGLDALHRAEIIHRDVKPANILFDEIGGAYITDFGLAKDTQASALTRPGQALGSLDYMAPEQIRGDPVHPTSDVYALGCVMSEVISGSPPFADRQGLSVMWAHLQDPAPDPCRDRAEVPRSLGPAILRALEKSPYRRPPTATDFALDLYAAVGRAPDGLGGT